MKRTRIWLAALGSAALVGTAGAVAELVSVDISNVANNIAKNINVDVSQIPLTIQVPVDVAANVCGIAANVLGQQVASGAGRCTAQSTSSALNDIVQQKVKSNAQK